MTTATREQVATALFALLLTSGNYVTSSRRLQTIDQVGPLDKPALFMVEHKEQHAKGKNITPAIRTMDVDVFIFISVGQDPNVVPMTALNNLIADFSSGTASATSASDISALTDGLTNVSTQRESLDSSLDRLQTASSYATSDATNKTAAVSTLVSSDPTTVATQLSSAETQNTSLMDVISTLEKQSLFDHIQ